MSVESIDDPVREISVCSIDSLKISESPRIEIKQHGRKHESLLPEEEYKRQALLELQLAAAAGKMLSLDETFLTYQRPFR
jgi:hypothetical protein